MNTYTLVTRITEWALRDKAPEAGTYMHDLSLNPNSLMFEIPVSLRYVLCGLMNEPARL